MPNTTHHYLVLAGLLTLSVSAQAAQYQIAGFTFETSNTVVSATIQTSGTSYSSPSTGQVWAPDPTHTIGNLVDGGGNAQNIDLTNGGSGNGGRTTVTAEFPVSPAYRAVNQPGDDLVVYEAGTAGAPEAFAVAVRSFPSGVWSQFRYEFADAQETSAGVNSGHLATGYDLTDFGVPAMGEVDAVRVCNVHNAGALTPPNLEDRVDSPTGQGNVTLDAGGSVGFPIWQGPAGGGNVTFANSSLDADITYIVALYDLTVPVSLSGFSLE